jgi:hypothetical protein
LLYTDSGNVAGSNKDKIGIKNSVNVSSNIGAGGAQLNLYGMQSAATYSGTINSIGSGNVLEMASVKANSTFSGTVADSSDAASVYGLLSNVGGDMGTTGTTAHYGASLSVSGTADNNYGLYINSVANATNNYGIYVNDTSAINYFGGNVGVGTTSPIAKLAVVSSPSLGAYTDYSERYNQFGQYAPSATLSSTTNVSMYFIGSKDQVSTSNITISNGGGRGIGADYEFYGQYGIVDGNPTVSNTSGGTTAGFYGVVGKSNITSSISNIGASTNINDAGGYFINTSQNNGTSTLAYNSYGILVQNNSSLMGVNSAGATTAYGAYITNSGSFATTTYGTYIQGTNNGGLNYGLYLTGVNAASGNYSIYSGSAAQSYFAGNIGIGTTTPAQALSVAGNMRLTGALFDSNNASGTLGMVLQTTGTGTQWVATSTLGITGGSGVTGGAPGMVARFTSATTLSTGLLIDNGTVAGVNATSSTITFNLQGSAGSNDIFNIASSSGTSILRVTNAGNIGIGTTTPTAMLMLQGTATGGDLLRVASSTGANMIFVSKFGGFVQDISSSTAFTIKDGSGNQVFNIDTTQSSTNAGLDITAGGSQTGNLLNIYSSGGTVLLGVSNVGGLVQNVSSTTAFQLQNGSGSMVFNVDTVGGKVGIGTTTGMSALDIISTISINESGNPSTGSSTATGLRVITSDDDSPSVLIKNSSGVPCVGQASGCSSAVAAGSAGILTIESSTSSNTSWYNLITAFSGTARSSTAAVFRVRGDGNVYGEAAFNASGADYAEYFDTFDTGIESGDLVIATTTDANLMKAALTEAGLSSSSTSTIISALATSTPVSTTSVNTLKEDAPLVSAVMKSQRPYDNKIIGIVSSQAAFIGNNPSGRSDSNKFKKIVGLVGRVPVKATNENGEIHVGDFVTSSGQFNGYAMKATRSGYVLGMALEDFKPNASSTSVSGTVGGTVLVFIKPGFQAVNNTFVLGENDGQIANATSTPGVVNGDSFIINQKGSGNILQLQSNGMDKFVINNSGSAVLYGTEGSNDAVLSVITASTTMFSINSRGDLTAKGIITVGKNTAGTAIIKSGDSKVTVTFTTPYPSIPKVLVTVQGMPNFFYGVTEKTETGFTITTSAPVPSDFSFDWVALNQPEDNGSGQSGISVQGSPISPTSQGGGSPSPAPQPTPADGGAVAGTSTPDTTTDAGNVSNPPVPEPTPAQAPTDNSTPSTPPVSDAGTSPATP